MDSQAVPFYKKHIEINLKSPAGRSIKEREYVSSSEYSDDDQERKFKALANRHKKDYSKLNMMQVKDIKRLYENISEMPVPSDSGVVEGVIGALDEELEYFHVVLRYYKTEANRNILISLLIAVFLIFFALRPEGLGAWAIAITSIGISFAAISYIFRQGIKEKREYALDFLHYRVNNVMISFVEDYYSMCQGHRRYLQAVIDSPDMDSMQKFTAMIQLKNY